MNKIIIFRHAQVIVHVVICNAVQKVLIYTGEQKARPKLDQKQYQYRFSGKFRFPNKFYAG